MKIGIVCPYDYLRFGGVQEHIKAVAEELSVIGYEVKVLAPTPVEMPKEVDKNIILLGASKKVSTPLATSAEVAVSASPKEIDAILKKENFDILHFHEPWVPVLSKQILSRSLCINVGTFHAKLPENLINKSIEKAWLPYAKSVAKRLDYITVVSTAASDYIEKVTDMPLEIIPNGIDLKAYDPHKTKSYIKYDDDTPTILFVGRLEKRKGAEYLLKAYKELLEHNTEVRLLIAGDGPKRRTLQNYVKKHNLENVTFLGFVSDEDKKKLLKTCDVFTSPALFGESFGIVLLEAMAMGKPIVAGNNPGYSSVMQQTGRLALVNPKSIKDYAHRLEVMLFDDEVVKVFNNWSKKYVEQFDYKHVAEAYDNVYKELLNVE